jgi:beta-N-acetylhexosaminidase
LVAELVEEMTVAEKVGQLFFARCPKTDAAALAAQYHLGGYLLFGRDFKNKTANQVIGVVSDYQAAAALPLLIGVDEEGGTVCRISSNPKLRESKFLSPQALYTQGGLEAILSDAQEKARLLSSLGVNVNFAPVADLSTSPTDYIYPRTLGKGAQETADYVAAVVERMARDKMGGVLKHFPGYGDNVDTHTAVAIDRRALSVFQAGDFLPFQAGIGADEAGLCAVLVSHNIMCAVDSRLPSSLSPAVHQLLRDELGFDGVVITDDLAMDAVESFVKDASAAVLAVLAGNDMLVSSDFQAQIPQVIAAVETGVIDEGVLDRAVTRVLTWKYNLGLLDAY